MWEELIPRVWSVMKGTISEWLLILKRLYDLLCDVEILDVLCWNSHALGNCRFAGQNVSTRFLGGHVEEFSGASQCWGYMASEGTNSWAEILDVLRRTGKRGSSCCWKPDVSQQILKFAAEVSVRNVVSPSNFVQWRWSIFSMCVIVIIIQYYWSAIVVSLILFSTFLCFLYSHAYLSL